MLPTDLFDFLVEFRASSTPFDLLQKFLGDLLVTLVSEIDQSSVSVANLVDIQEEFVVVVAFKAYCSLVVTSAEAFLWRTDSPKPLCNLLTLLQCLGKLPSCDSLSEIRVATSLLACFDLRMFVISDLCTFAKRRSDFVIFMIGIAVSLTFFPDQRFGRIVRGLIPHVSVFINRLNVGTVILVDIEALRSLNVWLRHTL